MTKRKRQTMECPRGTDRQYKDQEEKTDNTCPRGKDRQYNDQEEKTDNTMTKWKRQTIQ
jgi:hypothetical protein